MEEFNGILSLLVACIDLGLLVNLIIFSEKNRLNKSIILFIGLLMIFQLLDFSYCYIGIDSSVFVFVSLISFVLQPALALFIIARYNNITTKFIWLVFLAPLLFFVNFLFQMDGINLTGCTFFNAHYEYPLDYLLNIFYFLPLILIFFILGVKLKSKSDQVKYNMNLYVLAGYSAALIIGLLILLLKQDAADSYEGIFSKLSLLPAFALALLALKNRTNTIEEKD